MIIDDDPDAILSEEELQPLVSGGFVDGANGRITHVHPKGTFLVVIGQTECSRTQRPWHDVVNEAAEFMEICPYAFAEWERWRAEQGVSQGDNRALTKAIELYDATNR